MARKGRSPEALAAAGAEGRGPPARQGQSGGRPTGEARTALRLHREPARRGEAPIPGFGSTQSRPGRPARYTSWRPERSQVPTRSGGRLDRGGWMPFTKSRPAQGPARQGRLPLYRLCATRGRARPSLDAVYNGQVLPQSEAGAQRNSISGRKAASSKKSPDLPTSFSRATTATR
jgi:hypothetical protein